VKGRAIERHGAGGGMAIPDMGSPDGYQKKRVIGEAKGIVVKAKG